MEGFVKYFANRWQALTPVVHGKVIETDVAQSVSILNVSQLAPHQSLAENL